jgi:hypothetical protein
MHGKRRSYVFLDNRGFPNQSHKFDVILHNTKGGPILCKSKHPAPPLNDVDPRFEAHYNKARHTEQLHSELHLSHLELPIPDHLYSLLQNYWSVFKPVKEYKCSINTGSTWLICVKKINYGPWEIPIMKLCISSLAKLGHIHQIHGGEWLFKALLAPKPH